jgi:hypothetical protein
MGDGFGVTDFFISSIFPLGGLTILFFFDLGAKGLTLAGGFFFIGKPPRSPCVMGRASACGKPLKLRARYT